MEFLELFHAENPDAGPIGPRVAAVRREIELTGTYWHTPEELAFGARVAWRNNSRCIGRLYWRSLLVRDLRTVSTAEAVAEHCFEHLRVAHNGGRIRPTISVFAPETRFRPAPRIWNEQLVRYAGYEQSNGRVLGDPRYRAFTDELIRCGWQPPEPRGAFDVLPLVGETRKEGRRLFQLPAEVVHQVPLAHPELPWFAELGLRWHAVPAISNNRLLIGGISYPAAPFNGWYMGTEIGARNLGDSDRYALVPEVARLMGLDTSDEATLWRDRALVELNRAVLHSFHAQGVRITDHHTESRRFLIHLAREEQAGRRCPADWSWIVPPLSGSQTPVFHRYYDAEHLVPNFFTDDDAVDRALKGGPPPSAEPCQGDVSGVFAAAGIVQGMNTTDRTAKNRLVERLLADRHSLPLSIALHLVPGVLIVAAYLFIAEPITSANGYPTFLAWAIALTIVLYPLLFGLLWLGRRQSGRYTLRGVLRYLDKPISRGKLVAIVVPLIVWFLATSFLLLPLDRVMYDTFFTWVPFEGADPSGTGYIDGFSQSVMVTTLAICIPFTGFSLPLIEELYFRGFLLPRLPQLGRWAPLVNATLFSVYHFWSPWGVISRVVYLIPGTWLAWRKQDIRLTIGMHPGTTLTMQTLGTLALAFGLMP